MDKWYISEESGQPWSSPSNIMSLNEVFGTDNWKRSYFTTGPQIDDIFNSNSDFVFIEASYEAIYDLAYILSSTNLPKIEAWVAQGGRLFINAALTATGNLLTFNMGFDNTLLNYNYIGRVCSSVTVNQSLMTPFTPCSTTITGNYVSQGFISGSNLLPLMTCAKNQDTALGAKVWQKGLVAFGALTTPQGKNGTIIQFPEPDASNLRSNTISWIYKSPIPPTICK